MIETLCFSKDTADAKQIAEHLRACDREFVPPLSSRVDIIDYAHKLQRRAHRFEAWSGSSLVGLVAAYSRDAPSATVGDAHEAGDFITNVSVLDSWTGLGVASRLLNSCIEQARARGAPKLILSATGERAISLYLKLGFVAVEADRDERMVLDLTAENPA